MTMMEEAKPTSPSTPSTSAAATPSPTTCSARVSPTVTWERLQHRYARIGSQMLRLVVASRTASPKPKNRNTLQIIDKLIHDDAAREDVRQAASSKPTSNNTIYSTPDEAAKYSADAVDYVIANHDKLKQDKRTRPAIRIPRR